MTTQTTTENNSVAVTTMKATAKAKSQFFGYSNVLSSENTKVKNFQILEVKGSETEKVATWSIEIDNKLCSFKVPFSTTESYEHGTIGRYFQSIKNFDKNTFLHSFGNTPILTIVDFSNVFNIPLGLLLGGKELIDKLVFDITTFASKETSDTKDVKDFIILLESYGLKVDENNTYSAKIQSLTSLQKDKVYYKEKTSSETLKLDWKKELNLELHLSLKFESDSEKKSYGYTLESILKDTQAKAVKDEKFTTLSKDDKKDFVFQLMQKDLNKYKRNAIFMKLEVVEKEKVNKFDADSLFD